MWHDILSSLTIRDIVDGVTKLLVALALGYVKLRMDSERCRRREHERRVAATIQATHQPSGHHDARGASAGKEDGLHSEHDDPNPPSGHRTTRTRIRNP